VVKLTKQSKKKRKKKRKPKKSTGRGGEQTNRELKK
jgi:hypothetical protein